jgi:hypothetical protein
MANPNAPSDREVTAALNKLQQYKSFKTTQVASAAESSTDIDKALMTIETWATDEADDGQAWAQQRELEADQQISDSEQAQDQVKQDDEAAAEEGRERANLNMDDAKQGIFDALDDYEGVLQQEADKDTPWAKDKLVETQAKHAAAKNIIDEKLEASVERAYEMNAARRRQNKAVAEEMETKAESSREWKEEYSDQPAKAPAGQRADVKQALADVGTWTEEMKAQLEPFGGKAQPHLDGLEKAKEWSTTLSEQIDEAAADGGAPSPDAGAQGPAQPSEAMKAAKESGTAGVKETRATKDKLDAFLDGVEDQGNESMETLRSWRNHNNKLADEWINCDSPKHREWAKAWRESQKANPQA